LERLDLGCGWFILAAWREKKREKTKKINRDAGPVIYERRCRVGFKAVLSTQCTSHSSKSSANSLQIQHSSIQALWNIAPNTARMERCS